MAQNPGFLMIIKILNHNNYNMSYKVFTMCETLSEALLNVSVLIYLILITIW